MLGLLLALVLAKVAIAAGAIWWARGQHQAHPWTRDSQVLTDLVQVAPRVFGQVARVHVRESFEAQIQDLTNVIGSLMALGESLRLAWRAVIGVILVAPVYALVLPRLDGFAKLTLVLLPLCFPIL